MDDPARQHYDEAEAYVVRKNKQAIDGDAYIRLSTRYDDKAFLGSDSPYPKYLTYFVGTPPLHTIQEQLKDDGVPNKSCRIYSLGTQHKQPTCPLHGGVQSRAELGVARLRGWHRPPEFLNVLGQFLL